MTALHARPAIPSQPPRQSPGTEEKKHNKTLSSASSKPQHPSSRQHQSRARAGPRPACSAISADTTRTRGPVLGMPATARKHFQNGLLLPPSKLLPLLEQSINGYSGNPDYKKLKLGFSSRCSEGSPGLAQHPKCKKHPGRAQPPGHGPEKHHSYGATGSA